jgi:hypothetical protein
MTDQTSSLFTGSSGKQSYTFEILGLDNWKSEIKSEQVIYTSIQQPNSTVIIPVRQIQIKVDPDYLDAFSKNSNGILQYKEKVSSEKIRLLFYFDGSYVEILIPTQEQFDAEKVSTKIIDTFKLNN